MIASFTQFMLFLQLISIVILSVWLLALGWCENTLPAILISTIVVSVPRTAIIINNFFTSSAVQVRRENGKKYSHWQLLLLMLQEFFWSSVCWFWVLPFRSFRLRIDADHHGLPVLLIHGYGANSGFWRYISNLLQKQKIGHMAIDLEPVLGGIDDYATLINSAINTLCENTSQTQVIILAHSMGGLAARAYARKYGTEKIARLITMGTPHHGSTLASAAMGLNAIQMRWTDHKQATTWLSTLGDAESIPSRAKMVSIYSRHDNIVSPQHSAYLPHARNIELELVGHVALAFAKKSVRIAMQEINAARENRSISENPQPVHQYIAPTVEDNPK